MIRPIFFCFLHFLTMSKFQVHINEFDSSAASNLPSIERAWGKGNPDYDGTLSIVVVGASGNLAMLKVVEL